VLELNLAGLLFITFRKFVLNAKGRRKQTTAVREADLKSSACVFYFFALGLFQFCLSFIPHVSARRINTVNVVNWWRSRSQFITLTINICVQHSGREALRRAGLSAAADTCLVYWSWFHRHIKTESTPTVTLPWGFRTSCCVDIAARQRLLIAAGIGREAVSLSGNRMIIGPETK